MSPERVRARRASRPRVGLSPAWPVDGGDPVDTGEGWLLTPWPTGWRCMVVLDDRVRIRTRAGRDVARIVPAIAAAFDRLRPRGAAAGTTTILDVLLRAPLPGEDPNPGLAAATGADLIDLPCSSGHDRTSAPLRARIEELRGFEVRERDGLRVASAFPGLAADVLRQANFAGAAGASALLARREGSPYRPGLRTPDWRLFSAEPGCELVLCGITAEGALVLGAPTAHGLVFGGTTWPTREWRDLAARCREGAPAFEGARIWPSLGPIAWAAPEVWVRVRRDERPGAGTGGPSWRFVRCQEDLSA